MSRKGLDVYSLLKAAQQPKGIDILVPFVWLFVFIGQKNTHQNRYVVHTILFFICPDYLN